MINEVLFDVDGVVIKNRGRFFSEKYSEEYGVPIDKVAAFFKNEYGKCARGQADLKDVLPPYLQQWGWTRTVDDYMNYWFEGEKELEEGVLKYVNELRNVGKRCFLVSDQEKYRAQYLMQQVDLGNHFDGAFFSMDLGVKKSEVEFFRIVLDRVSAVGNNVMYWDDDPKNVAVASQLGIDGRTYVNFEDFEKQMKELNV